MPGVLVDNNSVLKLADRLSDFPWPEDESDDGNERPEGLAGTVLADEPMSGVEEEPVEQVGQFEQVCFLVTADAFLFQGSLSGAEIQGISSPINTNDFG